MTHSGDHDDIGRISETTTPDIRPIMRSAVQQNLGAIVRTAYCLGAAGVLGCSKNCAPLSAVVSKASAGGWAGAAGAEATRHCITGMWNALTASCESFMMSASRQAQVYTETLWMQDARRLQETKCSASAGPCLLYRCQSRLAHRRMVYRMAHRVTPMLGVQS